MAAKKNKGGRPRVILDWGDIEKLCHIQCTQEEIASWFGCSLDTVERACKREKKVCFAEFYAQKREGGRISLRRALFQKATDKNAKDAALIFACKNYLKMRDVPELTDPDAPMGVDKKRVYKVIWGSAIEEPGIKTNGD